MGMNTTMMDSVMKVMRPTINQDVTGGTTQEPFYVLKDNIRCSVQPSGASITRLYAQNNIAVTTSIYTTHDVGAEANDRIYVKDRFGAEHWFLVQGRHRGVFNRFFSPWRHDCLELI